LCIVKDVLLSMKLLIPLEYLQQIQAFFEAIEFRKSDFPGIQRVLDELVSLVTPNFPKMFNKFKYT
jgi:hypothetical protein